MRDGKTRVFVGPSVVGGKQKFDVYTSDAREGDVWRGRAHCLESLERMLTALGVPMPEGLRP